MEKHLFNTVRENILNRTFKVDVESDDEYDDVVEKWHKNYTANQEIEASINTYYLSFNINLCHYNYNLCEFNIEELILWNDDGSEVNIKKYEKRIINLIKKQIEIDTVN